MKEIVEQTIENLEKIKAHRIEERGTLSQILEDEIVVTIDNMIAVLKFEYLMKK